MKILKYLLFLVIVLAIIFFARGLMTSSISYGSSVTVDKSAKEAWAVMSDVSKLDQWITGFKKSELVSGTANTPGAVSNITVEDNGQEMVMQETINRVTPEKLLDMTFSMDFMDMDYVMTLDESNGKTVLKSNSVTKGNGLFAKSMISWMKGGFKEQEDTNMGKLKKLIDENTTNYFTDPVLEVDAALEVSGDKGNG